MVCDYLTHTFTTSKSTVAVNERFIVTSTVVNSGTTSEDFHIVFKSGNTVVATSVVKTVSPNSTVVTTQEFQASSTPGTVELCGDLVCDTPGALPVAQFSASPLTGSAPLTVVFVNQSTGTEPMTHEWDFYNDGTVDSTLRTPPDQVFKGGTSGATLLYSPKLTVKDKYGRVSSVVKPNYITVAPNTSGAIPVVNFTASVTSGLAPLTVTFTDTSTNSPTSGAWYFGDGNLSDQNTLNSTPVTFKYPGSFWVKHDASNAAGTATKSIPGMITVGGTPPPVPVAAFTASPITGAAPLRVTFTNQSTGNPTAYTWLFGDASIYRGTGWSPSPREYKVPGIYPVILTVSNMTGVNTLTKPAYITVTGTPPSSSPVASFTASAITGAAPFLVQFTDTSTGSPTKWQWNFGDNRLSWGYSFAQNPSFRYYYPGKYTITFTVTNAAGASHTITLVDYITVTPSVPSLSYSASPRTGKAPLTVQFTNSTVGSEPMTYNWDFDTAHPGVSTSTAKNPLFTYTTPGSYSVNLTARNTAGITVGTPKVGYITVT